MSFQRTGWAGAVLLLGLTALSGCGGSQQEQALEAHNRGVDHYNEGELDEGPAGFIRFHIEQMQCLECRARLDDLQHTAGDEYEARLRSRFEKATLDFLQARRESSE